MCFGDIQINTGPGTCFFVEVSRFNDFLLNDVNTVKAKDYFEIIQITHCKNPFDNQSLVSYIVKILQVNVPEKVGR
jgi:hypothetical protein